MYKHLQERYAPRPPVSIGTLERMKAEGEKIACMTAYDASFATLVDDAGCDLVLVGDSLGMVIQGHDTTVPVTLSDVIYHCRAVARGLYRPFLMADMPFMTYSSKEQALENAVRLMQEGGAKIVKLEGGASQIEIVEFLASHDIAVCAHLGLKPQSVHKVGGFRVQGREEAAADQMMRDAQALPGASPDRYDPGRQFLHPEDRQLVFGRGGRQCVARDHATEALTSALIGLLRLPDLGWADPWWRRMRYDGPAIASMRLRIRGA